MPRRSAGLLLYRWNDAALEVLIVHPGGPFWANKDAGAWSIPKGEYDDAEDALAAAQREFGEELGRPAPDGAYVALGTVRQKGGKEVVAWAIEAAVDVAALVSNTFEIEWPPRSGRRQEFPEVDRAEWCSLDVARRRLIAAQVEFVDRLLDHIGAHRSRDGHAD
ncbi:MAG: NUDIX domain-containing protein [Actinomycetota bacterium]